MLSPILQKHFNNVLPHLYINPLEKCNLKCKICYTRKTAPVLSNQQIIDFVEKYEAVQKVETITFCGGEVFSLYTFPALINHFTQNGIFVQIITNGTIDKLSEIKNPNMVNLIVSLDGLEPYHDANRGEGNYQKSTNFMKKAHNLGFHTEVFSIVTKQNLPLIDEFEKNLSEFLGFLPLVTYHPRKPPEYLTHHPVSNIVGEVNNFDFLNETEMLQVMKERNVFPPKNLGCYQVALVSDGKIFGCCEGVTPIGHMDDDVNKIIDSLKARILSWVNQNTRHNCLGCSQAEFMCGIKKYLDLLEKTK